MGEARGGGVGGGTVLEMDLKSGKKVHINRVLCHLVTPLLAVCERSIIYRRRALQNGKGQS